MADFNMAGRGYTPRFREMKLSELPPWFLERDDSIEMISMVYNRHSETPDSEDMKKIFDSVFVVLDSWEVEVTSQNDETDEYTLKIAEIRGFDTTKELLKWLEENEHKTSVQFIYHTRKKQYFTYAKNIVLEEEGEAKSEKEEASSGEKPTVPTIDLAWTPLSGLRTGIPSRPDSTPPGIASPRRAP